MTGPIQDRHERTSDRAGAPEFLRRYPPFDALTETQLERVAAGARLVSYSSGDDALLEDGRPSSGVFVVRTGAMALVHQDEVIDVLEPGGSFGTRRS